MTKKDYVKFAEAFKKSYEVEKRNASAIEPKTLLNDIFWRVVRIFEADNEGFDVDRFTGYVFDGATDDND